MFSLKYKYYLLTLGKKVIRNHTFVTGYAILKVTIVSCWYTAASVES